MAAQKFTADDKVLAYADGVPGRIDHYNRTYRAYAVKFPSAETQMIATKDLRPYPAGVPLARLHGIKVDAQGPRAKAQCPVCKVDVELREMKDEDSFSHREYRAHFLEKHTLPEGF